MYYLFKNNAVNIFTDASVMNNDGHFITCGGALSVITKAQTEIVQPEELFIDKYNHMVIYDGTNNIGELYAVYLGVLLALEYKDRYPIINIISDSQFAIYSVSRWIWKWRNNIIDGDYYNGSNKLVANQDILRKIIWTIINNNLYINFYHQKGHAKGKIPLTKQTFLNSNGIELNTFEATQISIFNDIIDNYTRDRLNCKGNTLNYHLSYQADFNEKLYKKLIGNKNPF